MKTNNMCGLCLLSKRNLRHQLKAINMCINKGCWGVMVGISSVLIRSFRFYFFIYMTFRCESKFMMSKEYEKSIESELNRSNYIIFSIKS